MHINGWLGDRSGKRVQNSRQHAQRPCGIRKYGLYRRSLKWPVQLEWGELQKQGQIVQGPDCVFRLIKALLLHSTRNQKPLSGLKIGRDAMILVLTIIWRVDKTQNRCFFFISQGTSSSIQVRQAGNLSRKMYINLKTR